MAVYYKFKSAKDFDSIPIDGHFISVANLKERIFEVKHLGRGTDFDLMVSNAQTNEEYADEAMLIPKNTSVLIRRVPGRPRKPIVAAQEEQKVEGNMPVDIPSKSNTAAAEMSATRIVEEPEWDEFGNDLYDIPEALPVQSSIPVLNMSPPNIVEEENKIKAFVDTSALDWQRQIQENVVAGRGYGRGMGGRMMAGRGIGRGIGGGGGGGGGLSGMMRKTPPQGYVCHRCNIPGHFIQHCPTNGDPNYDIKRVKPPTGIPKSMLIATPDGSYALPSGVVAVMKPNEAAFEREIEGLPSARPVTDFPPELRCPLCNDVMKDAVLTSKCCFSSFCDKCIRDYIISKSMCVCGATNVLADDLVPNKTVRVTINHILEATTSSADNAGSMQQLQDMESARPGIVKAPSPTQSATSKEGSKGLLLGKEQGDEANGSAAAAAGQLVLAMPPPESKEPTSQESALAPGEEASEKVMSSDLGKKKKKKARLAGEMQQWSRGYPEMENYSGMMPMGGPFNPVFPGAMPWGMEGFLGPIPGHSLMGYPHGPYDMPSYPYAPGILMPPPLPPPQQQLDFPEMSGPNGLSAGMSRNETDKRKEELRRRARESEWHHERGHSRDMDMEKDRDSFLRSRHRTEDRGERPGRSSSSRGLSADRAERTRSSRPDRDEKNSRASGSDRPEKSSRTSAVDRPEKSSRTNAYDQPEKSSRTNASDQPEKSGRTSGLDRPEKSSWSSGSERPEKSTRTCGSYRGEKSSREDRQGERSSRSSGSDRGEKSSREDHQGEKSTRSSGSDRVEKSTREDHQGEKNTRLSGSERGEKSSREDHQGEKGTRSSGSDRGEKSSREDHHEQKSNQSSGSNRGEKSSHEDHQQKKLDEPAEVLPPPPPLPASMTALTTADRKQKGSVFSRISFPESGKKRRTPEDERHKSGKGSSSSSVAGQPSGASEEHESDEDYHFKRRPAAVRQENEGDDARKGSSSKSSSTRDRDRRSAKRR